MSVMSVMSRDKISSLARLDHQHVWHPFTQMRDWLLTDPTVIVSGRGTVLRDAAGREYLDANSSIWTNLHGHNHPKLNAALRRQLGKIAHSSALGLANEPASLLAGALVQVANPPSSLRAAPGARPSSKASGRPPFLGKVFFSDDGSTAMEVAVKLAYEFTRRVWGLPKPGFLSLQGAYHGDTVGAASLGHIDLFHGAYRGLLFKSDRVMAPYCYRCPYNRAAPERRDAREYRRCQWECVNRVEQKFVSARRRGRRYAAMIVEPLMQGAAGMIPQPPGWLGKVAEIVRGHGTLLIADEVMTGFGRTGWALAAAGRPDSMAGSLFACQQENVVPDFMTLAKGLTGGYLPMAATLTTAAVFEAFLGRYDECKTFFHGHSYTANQLGAATALASLEILNGKNSVRQRGLLQTVLRDALPALWALGSVGDIRQVGLAVGVELVKDWRTREPFDWRVRAGWRVCEAMARRGVLTRPIGNVVVLMPPYCTTAAQARRMVETLADAIAEVFPGRQGARHRS